MSAKRVSTRRTRIAVGATALGAALALGAGTTAAFADTAPKAAQAVVTADKAASAKSGLWDKPLDKYTLSATFGKGGSMWSHKHSGQDFAVPVGTPVKAAAAGVVVKAGPNGGGDGPAYGNAIVIKHANNTYSQYAHLSRIQVRIGQKVAVEQRIALSGNTGNSSGPHLHFEIRTTPNYGSAVNPVAFLRKAGVTI
ncbi:MULTISPECIES: M23 family metallopeptidase [unclassified Streptomyces]|uniref:M23 family metallopeptidase n=1 Tax=Streptomyces sp. NPDC023588 TaxID=3154907 RepID=UPI0033C72285